MDDGFLPMPSGKLELEAYHCEARIHVGIPHVLIKLEFKFYCSTAPIIELVTFI